MFNEFSFVMENLYNYSEFDTGLLCGFIVFGLMVGSLISICLIRCFNPIAVVCIGIFEIFICGGLLVIPLILYSNSSPSYKNMNEYWTLIPLFLYVSADGLMLPHLISTALEPFKQQAGTASALAGFWRFFSAAVIALIVSSSSTEHLMVLHIGTASMAIVSAIMYVFTLYGADSSEFTASYDEAKLLANGVTLDGGVKVITDDDIINYDNDNDNDNDGLDDNSVNSTNSTEMSDETPLMTRDTPQRPVTIQA